LLASAVAKQAFVLAYIDGFLAAAVGALICLSCVMLLPATRFATQATNDRNRG
jgi:DHA2 family multidrug resistance protein